MNLFRKKNNKILVLILLVAALTSISWWISNLRPVSASQEKAPFVIEQGTSAKQLAKQLESSGLIREDSIFTLLCRIKGVEAKLKAGIYYFSPSMTPEQMIEKLLQGPEKDEKKITIPEGYHTSQIIDVLVKNGFGTRERFNAEMQSFTSAQYSFLNDIPNGENRLEGFLFPDTYYFSVEEGEHSIINRMLQRFSVELTTEVRTRLAEKNLSVFQWVTMGSLVEREAAKSEDRPVIAAIFEKRLQIGMPLQSCATIQYLLKENKRVLSLKDLEIDSPYNTYKHTGLPPGPIANPGRASLQAVLDHEKTEYLYFVAKSDGSHAFAKTNEEHMQNIRKYQ
ncbi:aminodeoxychorismate lyase [Syntrophobotulus glycolicus DSM 8271]|uniref:Endolytic murein transglycosylase n=2 Tax=Syntrophobotulus TaxID=51196 RepID=F0T0U9_SYNGF|nr:aminodeoxychorismate lyase [Syntrophobotulus glycolicus DSM 8271]